MYEYSGSTKNKNTKNTTTNGTYKDLEDEHKPTPIDNIITGSYEILSLLTVQVIHGIKTNY